MHVELMTERKITCYCKNEFGAEPNVNACRFARMPGALPMLNRQALEFAIKAGLACH